MTLEEAIKIHEENSKITWNGKPTIAAEECQQMVELLKELKAHREAWENMQDELNNRMQEPDDMHIGEDYYSGLCAASVMIDKYRPKEGDAE